MSPGRSWSRLRWSRTLPVGLGGLACVACCAVPLWLAGGLTLGGAAAVVDAWADALLPVIVLVASVLVAALLFGRWSRSRA